MPNGFFGSEQQWSELEAPLCSIDQELERFAQHHGMSLTRNYHNWPERSLTWYEGDVRKLLQIFLESEEHRTYTVWVCASEDRKNKRFWKQKTLKKAVAFSQVSETLSVILGEGKLLLDSWNGSHLELATEVGARHA